MRTIPSEEAYLSLRIAERYQVFREDSESHRRAIRLWQLTQQRDRKPESAEQLAHRRTWSSSAEQIVFFFGNHCCLLVGIGNRGTLMLALCSLVQEEHGLGSPRSKQPANRKHPPQETSDPLPHSRSHENEVRVSLAQTALQVFCQVARINLHSCFHSEPV